MCSCIGRDLVVENGGKASIKKFTNKKKARIRKANTNKIVSKIVNNSRKNSFNVKRRRKIKLNEKGLTPTEVHPEKLKFGSSPQEPHPWLLA